MRTIIIAAALVAACTDPNDDRAADCAPDVPECDGDCILVTGFDDEGRVVGVHARPATIYERETIA